MRGVIITMSCSLVTKMNYRLFCLTDKCCFGLCFLLFANFECHPQKHLFISLLIVLLHKPKLILLKDLKIYESQSHYNLSNGTDGSNFI